MISRFLLHGTADSCLKHPSSDFSLSDRYEHGSAKCLGQSCLRVLDRQINLCHRSDPADLEAIAGKRNISMALDGGVWKS